MNKDIETIKDLKYRLACTTSVDTYNQYLPVLDRAIKLFKKQGKVKKK